MNCTKTEAPTRTNSLAQLVADFLKEEGTCPRGEMKTFRHLPLKEAIKKAAQARDEGGRFYRHQWNLFNRPDVSKKSQEVLLACADQIAACKDFDSLLGLVESKLRIPGAGEMYWYDTAFRIAISLMFFPDKVYLHRGTRAGAIALGIYTGEDVLEMSELPQELRRMKPYQVEDFLCMRKDVLHRFKKGPTSQP
jgi:hypothetical protein